MTTEDLPEVAGEEVRRHPAHREIARPTALRAVLDAGTSLRGTRIQDLDLTPYEGELLAREDLTGLVVLGGAVSDRLADHLRTRGALVFPTDPTAPVNAYRATLYRPDELYAGLDELGYDQTADALAYGWSLRADQRHDVLATLVRATHDDSVTDALTEVLDGRTVVGVMGGHALQRGTDAYADAARLGHLLAAAGHVVLTGGGPGAMEAANLGALARHPDALGSALAALAAVPSFRPRIDPWASLALMVRRDLTADSSPGASDPTDLADPAPVRSIGVPTWFYGHEPPNVFCDQIAKYFSNALREDVLLSRCTAGLVVLPGAAGTVQEIFQAVTPLYYAPEDEPVPPLVLVGERHWRETLPVWPALQALSTGRRLSDALHLVDSVDDAAALLTAEPPTP